MRILMVMALAVVAASPVLAGDDWHADFDKAAALAKVEKKDLLVDFTGSDWCGWCIKLHNEVFSQEAFLTEAKKHFILVALDFPRSEEKKALVPNPTRNQELQKKHKVRGFPTVLLMTADGEVFGRTGYQAGGAEPYVKHLAEMMDKGKKELAKVKELIAAWNGAADDAAKAKVFGDIVGAMREMSSSSPGIDQLVDIAKTKLDDEAHQVSVAAALVSVGVLDDKIKGIVTKVDPKNEKGLLEKVCVANIKGARNQDEAMAAIKAFGALAVYHDKEECGMWAAQIALFLHHRMKDTEGAKPWIAKANLLGVKNENLKKGLAEISGSNEESGEGEKEGCGAGEHGEG
jgi:thioredoxin-related protein